MRTSGPEGYVRKAVGCADCAAVGSLQTRHINRPQERKLVMSKVFQYGGIVASIVLIAFGAGSIVTGLNGRDRVHNDLAREQIIGTPDSSIPNQLVDTGSEAEAFAKIMRTHTLEATGGLTYAQMGRYIAKPGAPAAATDGQGGTSDSKYALIDPKTKKPIDNGRRNVWVTETALSTALNTSYMAEQLSLFGIVVGIALLLSGIGFAVLAIGGALRNPETVLAFLTKRGAKAQGRTATAA
jgi:hypothetical protein